MNGPFGYTFLYFLVNFLIGVFLAFWAWKTGRRVGTWFLVGFLFGGVSAVYLFLPMLLEQLRGEKWNICVQIVKAPSFKSEKYESPEIVL